MFTIPETAVHDAPKRAFTIGRNTHAAEYQPQLILLDLGLPKLNGFEVARQIRQAPTGEQVMLVALSGWGQAEDRQRSAAAGFDLHLVKPVDPEDLTRILESIGPS